MMTVPISFQDLMTLPLVALAAPTAKAGPIRAIMYPIKERVRTSAVGRFAKGLRMNTPADFLKVTKITIL